MFRNSFFTRDWTAFEKWVMGIVSALVISLIFWLVGNGGMDVGPYKDIIATSINASARDGVRTPNENDATFEWGKDTLLDRYDGDKPIPPDSGVRSASWDFRGVESGKYTVSITYASKDVRPLRLIINGNVALDNIANEPTGGFAVENRKTISFGTVDIHSSDLKLTLETPVKFQAWPHFKEMKLAPISE